MANINGITLKAVKMFRGHEGEPCYQGNVYIGTKKIGFWSQDSWGGCDNFMFDKPYSKRKLESIVKNLNKDKVKTHKLPNGNDFVYEYSLERLFIDLLALQDDEKEFKRVIKNGLKAIMIVTDGYHQISWGLNDNAIDVPNEVLLKQFSKFIEKEKKKAGFFEENEWHKHIVKIYRSLDDFNTGVPVTLDDIKES